MPSEVIAESRLADANVLFAFLTEYRIYSTLVWNIPELKQTQNHLDPNYLYFLLKILVFRGYIWMSKDSILVVKRDFMFNGRHLNKDDRMFITILRYMLRKKIFCSLFY